MKSVGELLKSAREQKGWSLEDLSRRTKIQGRFLDALELSDFSRLPAAPFVKGFLRTVAHELDLVPETVVAVFRRDFQVGQKGQVFPRTLDTTAPPRSSWSPHKSLISGILIVISAFGLYLIPQLLRLINPPNLVVAYPAQNAVVSTSVLVEGQTDPTATVAINGQEVQKNADGIFSQTILLTAGTHTITIEARGENGKMSRQQRTVMVK